MPKWCGVLSAALNQEATKSPLGTRTHNAWPPQHSHRAHVNAWTTITSPLRYTTAEVVGEARCIGKIIQGKEEEGSIFPPRQLLGTYRTVRRRRIMGAGQGGPLFREGLFIHCATRYIQSKDRQDGVGEIMDFWQWYQFAMNAWPPGSRAELRRNNFAMLAAAPRPFLYSTQYTIKSGPPSAAARDLIWGLFCPAAARRRRPRSAPSGPDAPSSARTWRTCSSRSRTPPTRTSPAKLIRNTMVSAVTKEGLWRKFPMSTWN